jgi:cell wall-associated NlpC family hydrolase
MPWYGFLKIGVRYTVSLLSFALLLSATVSAYADAKAESGKIISIVDQECVRLNKDKMKTLLLDRLSPDIDKGLSPELLKIVEGVIKRTDFDNIPEEKTAEIISLVHESYKKGAPLGYLDEIFDAAYEKEISVESLTAAAKSLQEFHHSDVPPEIAQEFVYRSLEDGWDAAAVPVLTRGIIYGTERGLSPQRVALIIMLDAEQGMLKKESADQLVLNAIKLVRKREPKKWKPLNATERKVQEGREEKKSLAVLQKRAENNKLRKEEEKERADGELSRLQADERNKVLRFEQEQIAKHAQEMMNRYQAEIAKYQAQQRAIDAGLARYQEELEKEEQEKDREREVSRLGQLAEMQQGIIVHGKSGRLDVLKLYATVDRYMGIPYRYGGDSETGIDCSAFTRRVYRPQNVELPRTSREQASIGFGITDQIMRPGDLVFFDASITGRISHVGVYLGKGMFAHASSSRGVTKSNIREKYYMKRFVKAERIFEL